jgi:hypothetical protein
MSLKIASFDFDKDFGELVFRRGAKASQGVVLFRILQSSAATADFFEDRSISWFIVLQVRSAACSLREVGG